MRRTAMCAALTVATTFGVGTTVLVAQVESDDWVQFRGPGARGLVEQTGLPDSWSTTENVLEFADRLW